MSEHAKNEFSGNPRRRRTQFRTPGPGSGSPSLNDPSHYQRDYNDGQWYNTSSASYMSPRPMPGTPKCHPVDQHHLPGHASWFPSTQARGIMYNNHRGRRPQLPGPHNRGSINHTSSRFNRGAHNRFINENDQYRRQDGAQKKVKFVLSSSSCNRPSISDHPADDREFKVIYIGYKYIEGLTQKKPHEIVCEIVKSNSPFALFLNEPELEADWLMLVVEILKNLCASSFAGNIHEMLIHVLRSQLMHALVYYLSDIETETNTETIAKMKTFAENLTELLSSITNTLPVIAAERNVQKVITNTIKAIEKMNNKFQVGVDEEMCKKKLETLFLKINAWQPKQSTSSKQQSTTLEDNMTPPNDFRTISLHPTYEDLKNSGKFVFMRANKVKGSYLNIEHYLDVQFRLLREDFVCPLRTGLKVYAHEKAAQQTTATKRLKSKYESVRFYRDTKFEKRAMTKSHDLGYVLAFDPERRLKINWSSSKRFMFGSLLLFTTNDFETFFYGTVLERDEKSLCTGHVVVKLPLDVEITDTFFEHKYFVAESEVFFEPYYHVMRRIQTFKEDEFPMPQFIVEGKVETERPSYLRELQALAEENDRRALRLRNPVARIRAGVNEGEELQPSHEPKILIRGSCWDVLGHSVDLLRDDQWPTAADFKMDESQFEAFKTALTSNFCVIQGPPGTGKTFVGLKIVQTLLQNTKCPPPSVNRIKSPILIVCYTNHALDQFLEGIVPFTTKMIRAGSRSKSTILEKFNLRGADQRQIRWQAGNVHAAISSVRTEVENLYADIHRLTDLREVMKKPYGILKYELVEGMMEDHQKRYLRGEQGMVQWLLQPAYEQFNYKWYVKKCEFRRYDHSSVQPDAKENVPRHTFNADVEDNDLVDELLDLEYSDHGSIYCVQYADFEKIDIVCDQEIHQLEKQNMSEKNRKRLMKEVFYDFNRKVHEYEWLHRQLESASRFDAELCQKVSQKNIQHLTASERWQLYWSWVMKVMEMTSNKLNETEKKYAAKLEQLSECKQIEDVYVVERADVVGMTTSCAARLHHVLQTLKPAVVVIEEAAEVLESHIVASLTDNCQQLIMIGDHKQLKPSAAVYNLCQKYNFDVSLFERMINNGMYCPMLRVQHRMRPEISKLITPLIYPNLEDHESVRKFEPVAGVEKSVFFLEHSEFEEEVHDSSSRKNAFEAEFLLKFGEYLVHQGYCPTKITILTTYSGQMFLLREKKREYPALADVNCIVVDKYQGEENDIILLSLVRSNADALIGFLKTENRVCVALSRAKHGLYMIGNMDNLRASSQIWKDIHEILLVDGASGREMKLYCEKHDFYTSVSKPSDFNKVSQGGCNLRCAELLKCGHTCPSVCHKVEHNEINCLQDCQRKCARLHPCKQYCYETCNPCMVAVHRELPCSHEVSLDCHIDENEYKCEALIDDLSPVCGHPIKRKCGETAEQTKCTTKCAARLDCGHACPQLCHKLNDPDHLDFKCHRDCERFNEKCSKSHPCKKRCFEECGLCTLVETLELPCGHMESLPCFTDLNVHKCNQKCSKSCPDCNGACRKRCHETCAPCPIIVEKTIPDCGHKVKVACSKAATREICSQPCGSLAPCGHKCRARCSQPCGVLKCYELIETNQIEALCGHNDFVRIPCYKRNEMTRVDREKLLKHCKAPCNAKLKCGDVCAGSCGLCWQGRMHKHCQADCKNVLVCGHTCKEKCRQVCPPCSEDCNLKCEHSSCRNKCGVPCVKCLEKCRWRCKHLKCTRKCFQICNRKPCYEPCDKILPCGDPCIGYCGEPCPTECRKHNPEIREVVFGWEDEPDARFVKLNDCGHVIESRALDKHLRMPSKGGEIVMKACPLCKTPIVTTLRYKNIVRETYEHIINIKRKIFGSPREVKEKALDLLNRFRMMGAHYAQIIHLAHLSSMTRLIDKFMGFLSSSVHRRHQITISNADVTAVIFFHEAIYIILSRLGNLFDRVQRNEPIAPRRDTLPHWRINNRIYSTYGKIIELRLDESIDATKALTIVQHLVEKIDEIFPRLNQQQSEDISFEISRYVKVVDYCSALRNFAMNKNLAAVKEIRAKLEEILFGRTRFVPEQHEIVGSLFKKLESALKSRTPLTSEEKRMVHLAMSKDFHGGGRGHWFTCSRGHYYCITECGGANQLSTCPECGEKIGGQNHRYVDTMRLATDMDGAAHPAWSAGNHMRNYDPFA